MKTFPAKIIPLNSGVDDGEAEDADFEGIEDAVNVSFSERGGVDARQGLQQTGNFIRQYAITEGSYSYNTTPVILSSTQFTPLTMVSARNAGAEYPVVLCNGRTYGFDGTTWMDRLGATPMQVKRQTALLQGIVGGVEVTASGIVGYRSVSDPLNSATYAYNDDTNNYEVRYLDEEGTSGLRTPTTTIDARGTSARCGTVEGSVFVNDEKLIFAYRTAGVGVVTEVFIDDAKTPRGMGDNPVICCDQDALHFFVAWIDTTDRLCAAKITTAGVSVTGTVVLYDGSMVEGTQLDGGLWITNSTLLDNRVVVVYTNTATLGLNVIVRDMTLSAVGTSGTIAGPDSLSGYGACVCGVIANDEVWCAWTSTGGNLYVFKWNLTSGGTFQPVITLEGDDHSSILSLLPFWFIQHQPILFNGRVLFTVAFEPWRFSENVGPDPSPAFWERAMRGEGCTWVTIDLTDLFHTEEVPTYTSSRVGPALIARGPTEGSAQPWNPYSAVIAGSGEYYEFASIDWQVFSPGYFPTTKQFSAVTPSDGALAMNRLSLLRPQYAHFAESTVIAGSVPHALARGNSHELGWVETRPFIETSATTGDGSIPTDDSFYAARVVWRYTDEAGQVHRSEPSLIQNQLFPTASPTFDTLLIEFTYPQLSEKAFHDVVAEVYVSGPNPSSDDALYLQATVVMPFGATSGSVLLEEIKEDTEIIYTYGDVYENQFVSCDGGVVSVADRLWVSDGNQVYASKLVDTGEAPSFYVDGDLTLTVPPAAGRIVGLSRIESRIIILCERGVFVTYGDGPDNTGTGQDFLVPQQVGSVGCDNQRSIAATPAGVFFFAANTNIDSSVYNKGGLYLVNSGMQVTFAGQRLQESLPDCADMLYIAESDQLILTRGVEEPSSRWYVLHLRANQISRMETGLTDSTIQLGWCAAKGVAYMLNEEGEVLSWDVPNAGQDVSRAGAVQFGQSLAIDGIKVGQDLGAFGRFRAVKVFGSTSTTHALTITGTLDYSQTPFNSGAFSIVPGVATTRPTNRYAPEWRLPQQKGSRLSIYLYAFPAVAKWTALEVQLQPNNRAVAKDRR